MAIDKSSLKQIPTCYATCSIGKPMDPLHEKLSAISSAGFQAIELSFPDLLSFASSTLNKEVQPSDYDGLCTAAEEVKKQCDKLGLKILMLQPFANFEGWPEGSSERNDAFERAKGWIRIMGAAGMDMLQVGSSDSPNINTSPDRIAADLAALADLLAPHNYRLAYENWCWSTHAPTWKAVWRIVQKANRPNIGLCLDTFQTAGSEWADPTTSSGLVEDGPAGGGKDALERDFERSLLELSVTVPAAKIYLLQVSDAYRLEVPMGRGVDEQGLRARGRWSHDFRPLPFEGGYLPVVKVARAVLGTGFRGWFSVEVFDGGKDGKGKEYDLTEFAKKAMGSHRRLMKECADA